MAGSQLIAIVAGRGCERELRRIMRLFEASQRNRRSWPNPAVFPPWTTKKLSSFVLMIDSFIGGSRQLFETED